MERIDCLSPARKLHSSYKQQTDYSDRVIYTMLRKTQEHLVQLTIIYGARLHATFTCRWMAFQDANHTFAMKTTRTHQYCFGYWMPPRYHRKPANQRRMLKCMWCVLWTIISPQCVTTTTVSAEFWLYSWPSKALVRKTTSIHSAVSIYCTKNPTESMSCWHTIAFNW